MSQKNSLEQNARALVAPFWLQDSQNVDPQKSIKTWKDREGYIYQVGYKTPVGLDGLFLLTLLHKSQEEDWADKIELSHDELLQMCGISSDGEEQYERLKDSLKRWLMMRLKFQGTFVDGKEYKILSFGVIDSWGIGAGTKQLYVRFSREWLLRMKKSNYLDMIDVEQVRMKLASLLEDKLLSEVYDSEA